MTDATESAVERAEVVLPSSNLAPTLDFFIARLGFRLETISPADDPAVAVIFGHGLRLRLDRDASGDAGTIRLVCDDPVSLAARVLGADAAGADPAGADDVEAGRAGADDVEAHGDEIRGDETSGNQVIAPNGTAIVLVADDREMTLPPLAQSLVLNRLGDDATWGDGRAGMGYRDLIPDRQGGRFIASHISIPDGGPVPDYVHHHNIRFQLIFCYRGWTRLVYEDQGPPFILEAGDCVLQPPHIRHEVLEASPGLEVVEIGCPAVHDTYAEHEIRLPTGVVDRERDFGGQRFVHHRAADATWEPWRVDGWRARDSGIGVATNGLAGVRVVQPAGTPDATLRCHPNEFQFFFVLDGSATLSLGDGREEALAAGDCVTIPGDQPYAWVAPSTDLELLDVTLPGEIQLP